MDDWDEDMLGDELENEFDDEESVSGSALSDDEVELLGGLDGDSDASLGMPLYGSHGMSVDLDELTDEQRDRYEMGYHAGYDSGKNLLDDEDDF